ncbi:MAG: hypothetical protein ACFFD8_08470 [Candidatus Thorarchaeota archaeon]
MIFNSIRSTDVGSFPLIQVDMRRYRQGAWDIEEGISSDDADYFVTQHNEIFEKKFKALGSNQSVPCYVQSSYSRDMLTQFLDPIVRHGQGINKLDEAYLWDGRPIQLPSKNSQIAELLALKKGAKTICDVHEIEHITYRACITGPFEMMTRLWRGMGIAPRYDESLIEAFAIIIRQYMINANIETKYMKPLVFTLDEPSVGVTGIGDLFIDAESDTNLSHLLSCWNPIIAQIPQHCFRGLHLHASPYHQLIHANWNLLEAHIGVSVPRNWLSEHDRYIRAAILRTEGPTFPPGTDLKAAWAEIQSGNYSPYLQSKLEMLNHLKNAIKEYGRDRIPFAGPECGLGPWDWKYGDTMAITSLQRLNEVVTEFNQG